MVKGRNNMKTTMNFTQVALSAVLVLVPLKLATASDCYVLSPGCLDVTFDAGTGKVVADISPGTNTNRARGVAIQADWKIVAAGTITTPGTLKHSFALLRFNTDGSLDSSFGNGGVITTSFSTGNDDGWAVAIQPDGKIVTAGSAYSGQSKGSTQYVFAVARYNPIDGSLDSTFGSGGKTTVSFGSNPQTSDTEARAVAIQLDGRILVGGFAGNSGAIARLNSNGSLDPTFASGGKLTSAINAGPSAALVIQSDGKIVLGGWTNGGQRTGYDFAVARYNGNGSADSGFGNRGVATADFSGFEDRIRAVAMDSNNNIIAAGYASTGSGPTYRNFAVARFTPSGQLDPGFGNGGKVSTDVFGAWDDCYALAMQADGKILAGGFAEATNPVQFYSTVLRYNSNGALDSSFGTGGIVTTNIAGAPQNYVYTMAIQPDGKIVAGGSAQIPPTASYMEAVALARYLP
jgi:uncharacterized delta-60 repeat protein